MSSGVSLPGGAKDALRKASAKPAASGKSPAAAKARERTKPRKSSSTSEATAEQAPVAEEASPDRRRLFRTDIPSWLVSTLFHLVVFVILALCSFRIAQEDSAVAIISSRDVTDSEFEEIDDSFDLEVEPIEDLSALPSEMPDPGLANLGEIASVDTTPLADVGSMAAPTSLADIGAPFGSTGTGLASSGMGDGGATFFGKRSSGRRFVFVVDNSNSMTKGRFETALHELVETVKKLGPEQEFYVLFFSDTAYPLFHPQPVSSYVKATPENKLKLRKWLTYVELCLRTDAAEAVEAALKLRPDAVYLLGDGEFTDNTVAVVKKLKDKVPIHTLGMEINPRGERDMRAISDATGGTYRAVAANPLGVAMAKQHPIKKNNKRGPIWGITLPAANQKAQGPPRGKAQPKKKGPAKGKGKGKGR